MMIGLDAAISFAQSVLEALSTNFIFGIVSQAKPLKNVKLLIFVVLMGLTGATTDYFAVHYHILVSILIYVLSYALLVRRNIISLIIDVVSSVGLLISLQFVITVIVSFFYKDFASNDYVLFGLLATIVVIPAMLTKMPGIHNFFERYYEPNKTIVFWIAISIVLLMIVLVNIFLHERSLWNSGVRDIFFIAIAYFVVNILSFISLYRMKNEKQRNNMIMEYGNYLEGAINELRSVSHDQRGHFQMILRMAEQGQNDEAIIDYVQNILGQHKSKENLSHVKDNVLLSAFLHNSKIMASGLSIRFYVNVAATLSSYKIPTYELVDILINLINNAFEEVANLPKEDRIIHIDFNEKSIEIRNTVSGKTKSKDTGDFLIRGFSTKGLDRGFGISNIINMASKHNVEFANYFDGDYYISVLSFEEQNPSNDAVIK